MNAVEWEAVPHHLAPPTSPGEARDLAATCNLAAHLLAISAAQAPRPLTEGAAACAYELTGEYLRTALELEREGLA